MTQVHQTSYALFPYLGFQYNISTLMFQYWSWTTVGCHWSWLKNKIILSYLLLKEITGYIVARKDNCSVVQVGSKVLCRHSSSSSRDKDQLWHAGVVDGILTVSL